jgi:hypothetical protein
VVEVVEEIIIPPTEVVEELELVVIEKELILQ